MAHIEILTLLPLADRIGLILLLCLASFAILLNLRHRRRLKQLGKTSIFYRLSDRELSQYILLASISVALITHFLLAAEFVLACMFALGACGLASLGRRFLKKRETN